MVPKETPFKRLIDCDPFDMKYDGSDKMDNGYCIADTFSRCHVKMYLQFPKFSDSILWSFEDKLKTFQLKPEVRKRIGLPDSFQSFKAQREHFRHIKGCYSLCKKITKLLVKSSTLDLFEKMTYLDEVNLSYPRTPLPKLKGKTRKESGKLIKNWHRKNAPVHSKVLKALRRHNIDFVVVGLMNYIFVKKFGWETIGKLRILANEVPCDLMVSGGENVKVCSSVVKDIITFTQGIFNRIASRVASTVRTVLDAFVRPIKRSIKRSIKCAIIDSGCLASLYHAIGRNHMHHQMLAPVTKTTITDGEEVRIVEMQYGPYDDPFVDEQGNRCHGTGVTEIFLKYAAPNVKTYVASLGSEMLASTFVTALKHMVLVEDVHIINCSLTMPEFKDLTDFMEVLHEKGTIFVGAAGNDRDDFDNSGLNDGKTIMVGSHDINDVIVRDSIGGCEVDICSSGENVRLHFPVNHVVRGTSYATPRVTAALANHLSRLTSTPSVNNLKRTLLYSAELVFCTCQKHPHGYSCYLKLNPDLPRAGLLRRFSWNVRDMLNV